eukprot:1663578-Pyramimonas_sp.AAC.1
MPRTDGVGVGALVAASDGISTPWTTGEDAGALDDARGGPPMPLPTEVGAICDCAWWASIARVDVGALVDAGGGPPALLALAFA